MSFFTGSGSSYGTAVPFQRIVEPAQLGLFLNLEQAELLRIQRYNEHWRFYFAKHWAIDREDGEPLVTVNYSRLVVDKAVTWLVKGGFEIDVPEILQHIVGNFLEEVWEYNGRDKLLYNIGIMGTVTGDVFLMVTYEEPTELAKIRNPNSRGSIRINLLGSEQVFPTWDPLNTEVLTSVRIETIYYDDRNQLTRVDNDDKASHAGRELHVKKFTQILTPEFIIEQYEGAEPKIRQNVLGEIPIVHISNLPVPREFYGLSDLDCGIIDLNREFNEKATDVSDIISYQAAPVTVITGAKASSLERSAKQVWSGLPADARVSQLELRSDLAASQNYLERMKTAILEISETPLILLQTPPISNASGVALHMQYGPIVDKTKRKIPFYEDGLQKVNYLILRIGVVLGMISLPFDLCKNCGGRIVEVLDDTGLVPRTLPKCFKVDHRDFSFVTPEQVEIPHVRQHSFGEETRESPLDRVEKEHGKVNPSRYDPEPTESQEEKEERERSEQDEQVNAQRTADADPTLGEPRRVESPSTKPSPPKMAGDIRLPPEPERVLLSRVMVHPITGAVVQIERRSVELVPTGCDVPQYLDPYRTKVKLLDALPRDDALDATLHMQLQGMGIVSKKWIRRNTRIIKPEDYDEIEEELREESSERTMASDQMAEQIGPQNNSAGTAELARSVTKPGGHNQPSRPPGNSSPDEM